MATLCSAVFLVWTFWSQHLLDMRFYLKKFSQLVGKRGKKTTPGQAKGLYMCCDPAELSGDYSILFICQEISYVRVLSIHKVALFQNASHFRCCRFTDCTCHKTNQAEHKATVKHQISSQSNQQELRDVGVEKQQQHFLIK